MDLYYSGYWKESVPHGPGFLHYTKEDFVDGIFENGVLKGFSHLNNNNESYITQMPSSQKKDSE